jgi:predicted RNA-binding Zn ribbon-like protein
MDLPDSLELPLERGAPWFYWLGGRPALDFVNTRRERWWRDVETLVTPQDLADWVVQAGLLPTAPDIDEALLAAARDLREAVSSAAVNSIEHEPVSDSALAMANAWLPYAHAPAHLHSGEVPVLGSSVPPDAGRHALGLIALDAAHMLGTAQRERIRVCGSDTCSARFFDRSRGGRRRWCSMEACGNVAKARRYRARQANKR